MTDVITILHGERFPSGFHPSVVKSYSSVGMGETWTASFTPPFTGERIRRDFNSLSGAMGFLKRRRDELQTLY